MVGFKHRRALCVYLFLFLPDLSESIRDDITKKKKDGLQLTRHNQHQTCIDELYSSDLNDDMKINESEYVVFVEKRSKGAIDVDSYSELPFSLISNFVYGSCFCSLFLQIPDCCVGTKAAIELDPNESPFIEDNLVTICKTVDKAIVAEIGTSSPATTIPSLRTSKPTNRPSNEPTVPVTTESPSEKPIGQPTEMPSEFPTETVTETPSITPTYLPTKVSSKSPTMIPTMPTLQPTPDKLVCVHFQYGIENDEGITARDILEENNNSYKNDLIAATRNITLQILNETYPHDSNEKEERYLQNGEQYYEYSGRAIDRSWSLGTSKTMAVKDINRFHLDQINNGIIIKNDSKTRKRRRAAFLPSASLQTNKNASYRRLAFYTDSHPPMINNIFDNKLCQAPEGISCAVVDSTVCFFLEEGDDEDEVGHQLLGGIQASMKDGSFERAIPSLG